jgi:hypothetical protein
MRKLTASCSIFLVAVIVFPLMSLSQERVENLKVAGHAGNVPVTHIDGKEYVEVGALARHLNGALSVANDQLTLTPSSGECANAAKGAGPEGNTGFSSEFLRAGIEAMSTIREWHSALSTAIANQYPITKGGLMPLEAQAMKNVRLAQAAGTTEADHSAIGSIRSVYDKMKALNDKYLAKRSNLTYIAPDSLKNDSLDQSIVACGKSLGAMAASGHFGDDRACR